MVDKWKKGCKHTLLIHLKCPSEAWSSQFQAAMNSNRAPTLLNRVPIDWTGHSSPRGSLCLDDPPNILLSARPYVFPDRAIPDMSTFQPKLTFTFSRLRAGLGGLKKKLPYSVVSWDSFGNRLFISVMRLGKACFFGFIC